MRVTVRKSYARLIHTESPGVLMFAFVPNPLYAWSSVAAGASRTKFGRCFTAAATGSFARFILVALLGKGIEKILG